MWLYLVKHFCLLFPMKHPKNIESWQSRTSWDSIHKFGTGVSIAKEREYSKSIMIIVCIFKVFLIHLINESNSEWVDDAILRAHRIFGLLYRISNNVFNYNPFSLYLHAFSSLFFSVCTRWHTFVLNFKIKMFVKFLK